MELLTTLNAASPRTPETLTIQRLVMRIGTETSGEFKSETFTYAAGTMSAGINLAAPVAAGTTPDVYLRGLHMVVRPSTDSTGGDVRIASSINPDTLEITSKIVFVGTVYTAAEGDTIHVKYFTPADDADPVYEATAAQVSTTATNTGVDELLTIPTNHDAISSTASVFVNGVDKTEAEGWTAVTEERTVGAVTITALVSVLVDGSLITGNGQTILVTYQHLAEI